MMRTTEYLGYYVVKVPNREKWPQKIVISSPRECAGTLLIVMCDGFGLRRWILY
jgi:hypothetical protein